ncbi:MAG: DUF5050 domain-containing protein [Ferruginibacter sp.]
MKKITLTVLTLSCLSLLPYKSNAQIKDVAAFNQYFNYCINITEGGNNWISKNKDYNPADSTMPSYYQYQYDFGKGSNALFLKIKGYLPKKSEWVIYWDGFYSWDKKLNKVTYQSENSFKSLAEGVAEKVTEKEMVMIFTITHADGSKETHKDIEKLEAGKIISSSLILTNNTWKPASSLIWTKMEEAIGYLSYLCTADGNFEVYSMNAQGYEVKNLTNNKALDFWSSWSPDGKYILFYSNRDGNNEIYRMNADGSNQVNLSNHPSHDYLPDWSPDGKKIIFTSDRDDKNREIYTMNIDGSNVQRLTNNELFEEVPVFSPDGKKVLFTRQLMEQGDTSLVSNGEVFIMDANGKNEKRLTQKKGYDSGAKFSPDGKRIAFYGPDENKNYEIFIMNADGSNMINLTEDPLEDYSPSWSPDGKWIAYTNGDSKNYDVWIINVQTRIKKRLTTQSKRDETPVWKPVF